MNTSDYIAGCIAGKRKKAYGHNGHIVWQDGVVYSYGAHYPLCWKLGNGWMLNNRGYSISTSKHICQAWGAIRRVTKKAPVSVKLPRRSGYSFASHYSDIYDVDILRRMIAEHVQECADIVKNTKRKNTKTYQWRLYGLREARKNARRFEKLAATVPPAPETPPGSAGDDIPF